MATISAVATQRLCRFNLDFQGMTVRSVTVDGRRAGWTRSLDHELTVTPKHKLKQGRSFRTVVRYDGVPRTQVDLSVPEEPLPYGWIHTDDGSVVVSEPEGSANWFPLNDLPADDPFWDVVIGDPGIPFLFHGAVYVRGAMTLQALRNEVGHQDFFRILRAWAQRKAGGNGTTAQFIALAETISGEQLDGLFDAWLLTPGKPAVATSMATGGTLGAPATAASAPRTPPAAASLLERSSLSERR